VGEDRVHIYRPPRTENIAEFLTGLSVKRLGIEAPSLDVSTYLDLAAKLDVQPVKNMVERLRIIKEPAEIERMRRSCTLNHEVFGLVPELLVPGKTEVEVAWELEQAFRNRGASELSFATIVGVGPNAALPHAIPGQTPVAEDQLVLVDMGCRLDDYCSDQTRTFFVGEPSERFRLTLELVQEAQAAAIAALRPGLELAEAYRTAWQVLDRAGKADQFTHGLGHGIGLETHEGPSLGPKSQGRLEAGMIVTVEPCLYDMAWGGIRWEHMLLITEDGAEAL
jgi:Xaa-Pro aminopeptidase